MRHDPRVFMIWLPVKLGPHCHVLGNPGKELRFGTCPWDYLVDGSR